MRSEILEIQPKYRYGFNGMERDDEMKGIGNSHDFGARLYDPRLGRWMSTDKMQSYFPGWTTYKAFLNSPIAVIDADGNVERDSKTGRIIFRPLQINYEDYGGDGELNSAMTSNTAGYITANDGKTSIVALDLNMVLEMDYVLSDLDNRSVMEWNQADQYSSCAFGSNCYGVVLTNGNYKVLGTAAEVHNFLLADGYENIKKTNENNSVELKIGDVLLYTDHAMRVVDIDESGQPIFESRFAGDAKGALGTIEQVNEYHSEREGQTFSITGASIYRSNEGDSYIDQSTGKQVKLSDKKKIENVQGGT